MKRKLLSIILILCMLLSIAPLTVTAADDTTGPGLKMGDIIEFGSYPQSEVKDSELIAELNKLDKNWKSCDYSYGTGRWQEALSCLDMNYADISYSGEKYRAVTFSQYRPNLSYLKPEAGNSYQCENGYFIGNVYYFKYEPLKWRVIDPVEGFVICTQAIDSRAYRENYYTSGNNNYRYCFVDYERYASDWKVSEIRTWLNGDFCSMAFTDDELSKIGTTENESKSVWESKYDGAKSYDKVFLLSNDEAVNSKYGFNTDKYAEDSARLMTPTDYAKCQGIAVKDSGTVGWILRSPFDSAHTSSVGKKGTAGLLRMIDGTENGIVPAFKLNPAGYEISVTFDLNGGEWADGYTAPASYLSNEALQLPTDANVKKTGLMLEGWEEMSRADTSVSYKAKWTARMYDLKYTLFYNDLGLTGKNELLQSVEYGKVYVFTFDTAPKGCEYVIDKFYVKIADASGNMQLIDKSRYAIDTENCTITIPGELVKGNIEIYIERDRKNYTVKFKDTGSATIADKTVHWNDKVLDGVAEPTKDGGFEFAGWSIVSPAASTGNPNGTYAEIAGDDNVGSITLRAIWRDISCPQIFGLEDGKTYCGAQKFTVNDNVGVSKVIANGEVVYPDNDGCYTAPASGEYEIKAIDAASNEYIIKITVNAGHSYGDWKFDDTDHWKECSYGDSVTEKGEHSFEWITDKEASESEAGVKHEECSVCHATRNENTEIPRIPTKWEKIKAWFVDLLTKIIKWIIDIINTIC